MDAQFNRTGLTNFVALLLAAVVAEVLSRMAGSSAGEVAAALLVLGALVALVSWFQMRLAAREEAERVEMEDLARRRSDSSLFAESAADAVPSSARSTASPQTSTARSSWSQARFHRTRRSPRPPARTSSFPLSGCTAATRSW